MAYKWQYTTIPQHFVQCVVQTINFCVMSLFFVCFTIVGRILSQTIGDSFYSLKICKYVKLCWITGGLVYLFILKAHFDNFYFSPKQMPYLWLAIQIFRALLFQFGKCSSSFKNGQTKAQFGVVGVRNACSPHVVTQLCNVLTLDTSFTDEVRNLTPTFFFLEIYSLIAC